MQHSLFSIRLVPGTEEEYDRRHAQVWPEMVEAMHECGITNSTGFRRGTEVFYYAECDPTRDLLRPTGADGGEPALVGALQGHRQRPAHRGRPVPVPASRLSRRLIPPLPAGLRGPASDPAVSA